MCADLLDALQNQSEYGYSAMSDDDASTSLAFVNFFASPIEKLDEMAAIVMMEENISYEDVVTEVAQRRREASLAAGVPSSP